MKNILLGFALTGCIAFNCSAQTWKPLGQGWLGATSGIQSIATDTAGVPYIVYPDGAHQLILKKFDGANWVAVGTPTSFSVLYTSMVIDKNNTIYIGFLPRYISGSSDGKPRVIKYENNSWSLVGNPISFSDTIPPSGSISLVIDKNDTLYFAFADRTISPIQIGNAAAIMKFDGSDWVQLGNPNHVKGASYIDLALDTNNNLYVATSSDVPGYNYSYVQKYKDTAWEVIASTDSFSNVSSGVGSANIAVNPLTNQLYAIYYDSACGGSSVKIFDGAKWQLLGDSCIGGATSSFIFDENGLPLFPYIKLKPVLKANVEKYNGSNWITLGLQNFTDYSLDHDASLAIGKNNMLYLTYISAGFQAIVHAMYLDTSTLSVKSISANNKLKVYPNPVSNQEVNIEVADLKKGNYSIQLFNEMGQMVYQSSYNHKSGDATIKIDLNKQLPNGLYHLKISDGATQFSSSLLVSN